MAGGRDLELVALTSDPAPSTPMPPEPLFIVVSVAPVSDAPPPLSAMTAHDPVPLVVMFVPLPLASRPIVVEAPLELTTAAELAPEVAIEPPKNFVAPLFAVWTPTASPPAVVTIVSVSVTEPPPVTPDPDDPLPLKTPWAPDVEIFRVDPVRTVPVPVTSMPLDALPVVVSWTPDSAVVLALEAKTASEVAPDVVMVPLLSVSDAPLSDCAPAAFAPVVEIAPSVALIEEPAPEA